MPAFIEPTITKVETIEERAPHLGKTPDHHQKVGKLRLLAFYGAVLTAMYLVALAFTPNASSLQDLALAVAFAFAAAAITRLGPWRLSPRRSRLFAAAGVVLLVTSAVAFTGPVQSSTVPGTNATCGSIITGRSFDDVWAPLSVVAIEANCHDVRRERLSVAVMQLQLASGALYLGREFLWVRRRVFTTGIVVALACLIASTGWTKAVISNADAHNMALAPWFAKYGPDFERLGATNQDLRAALVAGNGDAINAACAQLITINDQLSPSVADWPTKYADQRATWQQFLVKHREDATACTRTSQASGSTEALRESEWFSGSSQGLDLLRPVLDYK